MWEENLKESLILLFFGIHLVKKDIKDYMVNGECVLGLLLTLFFSGVFSFVLLMAYLVAYFIYCHFAHAFFSGVSPIEKLLGKMAEK